MILKTFKLCVFTTLMSLMTSIAIAAAPSWQIAPEASKITFSATQNNAPVTGEFKNFTGNIAFDPADLATSSVTLNISMASVAASYAQVADTLKSADWFDSSAFPQAVFKSDHFTKTGDKTFTAEGKLTVRDKTVPVTINFTLEKFTDKEAEVKGTAMLKRLALGVGQRDWAKTDAIKDDVSVDFVLSAKRK